MFEMIKETCVCVCVCVCICVCINSYCWRQPFRNCGVMAEVFCLAINHGYYINVICVRSLNFTTWSRSRTNCLRSPEAAH